MSTPQHPASLAKTTAISALYALVTAPDDVRDDIWKQQFLEAAWLSPLILLDGGRGNLVVSLDGFPYIRVALPRPGEDYQGHALQGLSDVCLEKGVGIAVYLNKDDRVDEANCLFSLRDLNGICMTNGSDRSGTPFLSNKDVISPNTARTMNRHLKAIFPDAKPSVFIKIQGFVGTMPDVGLCPGIPFAGLTMEKCEEVFNVLEWCLPPGVTLRLMDSSASGNESFPLEEFF